jgi:hypothetical protein
MEREGVPIYTDACLRQPYNGTDGKTRELRPTQPNGDERRTKMPVGPTRRAPYVAPRSADFERA